MVRYSTVLFDADNTLFDFYRSEREALMDALRSMGVCPTQEMVAVYSKINESMWKMLERGEITKTALREARFARFCEHYGFSLDVPQLAVRYTDFLAQKGYLMQGVYEACRALAESCRLYIITNGISTVQRGRFEPSVLRPFFRDLFISEELGYEKPRKEYFEAVAAAIPNFDARSTLVVGDSLTSDMQGGINAGLDTCWVNPHGKPVPADMPITYVVKSAEEVVPLVLGA